MSTIAKKWWDKNEELLETEKQHLIQAIGIDKYNQDIDTAKMIIQSIEEQARNYNWESTLKHAKATELITKFTGLTSEQIFNVIKATVNEWNSNKPKTETVIAQSVEQAGAPIVA